MQVFALPTFRTLRYWRSPPPLDSAKRPEADEENSSRVLRHPKKGGWLSLTVLLFDFYKGSRHAAFVSGTSLTTGVRITTILIKNLTYSKTNTSKPNIDNLT